MTTKYKITHKGHPELPGHKVGSIIPMGREGKWADNTLEIVFENPVHDIVPDTTPDDKIIEGLLGQAAIEPWKVQVVPDSLI